jgi:hypothetical protein
MKERRPQSSRRHFHPSHILFRAPINWIESLLLILLLILAILVVQVIWLVRVHKIDVACTAQPNRVLELFPHTLQ